MINGSELRKGVMIELDGKIYQVTDYRHVKMKRTALAKVKLRDVEAGHITEHSFQSDQKFTRVRMDYQDMQYLYNDGGLYYFMDTTTFDQMPVEEEMLGDSINYMKENMMLQVTTYKGKLMGVELPPNVELEVTATEPGFKGDTATGGTKPATLETGITVNVPLFINQGDILKVDTRDGSYVERVSAA